MPLRLFSHLLHMGCRLDVLVFRSSTLWILECVRNELVTKHGIHLLQSSALGLGIEEPERQQSHDIEDEEDVKVSKPDPSQGNGRELRKDEVDGPVGEGRDGVAQGADLDGEDLGRVHPGDDTQGRVEEAEDKVHGHHGPQLVVVLGVQMLGLHGVDKERGAEASGRHDQGLDAADLVESPQADGAVDDGQRAADADDHERGLCVYAEDGVDSRSVTAKQSS